jgi:hypothetical protein
MMILINIISLFSFKEAEAYYIKDQDFDNYLKTYSHAIPLAKHKEGLFVLAEKESDIYLKASDNSEVKLIKTKDFTYKTKINIIIIGQNNKLQFIKTSFDEYASLYQSDFKVKYINDFDIEKQKDSILAPDKNKTLLLLSDEFKDPQYLDANIINNLIYLQSNIDYQANIIVEVLDPANDQIIKEFNINNTIISNKIISLLISKIVLYKETAPFYENLLTIKSDITGKDDQNISIIDAHQMIDEGFPIDFESKKHCIKSIYHAFNKKMMMFGYIRDGKINIFYGNLHQKEKIQIHINDKLIFMKL